jgi:ABC-type nitrate/sulfonate/bicarbonate transport system permease component
MSETDGRPSLRGAGYGVLGVGLLIGVWQILGAVKAFGSTVPTPTVVARVFGGSSDRTLLVKGGWATALEAIEGFGWALVLAAVAGILVSLLPVVRRGVDQLATIQSAIPFVALAPVLLAIFSREHVPAAMAAATAFFPLYIAFVSGLEAVSPTVSDLCTVLGARKRDTLLRARIPAGLPVLATGTKVAIPLAIVGAVIGEWFGASSGVGPIMLVAMRNYEMATMWAAVTVTVVVALVLYGICALVERLATVRFG